MKKKTFLIITIILGITVTATMYTQVTYIHFNLGLLDQQFNEKIQLNLLLVALKLEEHEALEQTVEVLNITVPSKDFKDSFSNKIFFSRYATDSTENINRDTEPATIEKEQKNDTQLKELDTNKGSNRHQNIGDSTITESSFYLKELERRNQLTKVVEQIVSHLLEEANKTISERINFKEIKEYVSSVFRENGVKAPFNLYIIDENEKVIYEEKDPKLTKMRGEKSDLNFQQRLFPSDPTPNSYYLKIAFPTRPKYSSEAFMLLAPPVAKGLLIFIMYIVGLYIFIRQKHLNTMKNDFINSMTHELKTPISTISLASQLLTDSGVKTKPNRLAHYAKIIKDETERLRRQVDKVLEISLFEKEEAILDLHELSANAQILEIINIFSIKVTSKGGKVTHKLDAEKDFILADEVHFTNILFNLMDNALKYSVPPLLLTIETYNIKDQLIITVEDNGIGIKKENLKFLFDKFYRVSTGSRHDVKGFGLGLTYVKSMIKKHKGEIKVTSELGVGTKFTITIPTIKKNKK